MCGVKAVMHEVRTAETPLDEQSLIERGSPADLAFLAMDTGAIPEQFAVILILEQLGDFGLRQLRELIMDRIRAFPRLRQRLIKVPFGCGSGLGR